jgi:hypothetical protein
MLVDIVSPSGRVFSGEATRFKAPGVEGSFEVLKNHAPMLAAIEIGTIVVTGTDGKPFTIATSGGFVEVQNNRLFVWGSLFVARPGRAGGARFSFGPVFLNPFLVLWVRRASEQPVIRSYP